MDMHQVDLGKQAQRYIRIKYLVNNYFHVLNQKVEQELNY